MKHNVLYLIVIASIIFTAYICYVDYHNGLQPKQLTTSSINSVAKITSAYSTSIYPSISGSCIGNITTQTQTNVTKTLSANGNGVTVYQITSANSMLLNGSSAQFIYYDTPVYSKATGKIIYWVYAEPYVHEAQIVMANMNGTDPQIIYKSGGTPFLTSDGRLVLFTARSSNGATSDIYAINITKPGECKAYRLSYWDFPNGQIPGTHKYYATVYYYSEYDPQARQDIIYAWQYSTVYRMYENGTELQPVTIQNPYGSKWATFHHLKPNPRFPNVVAFLWNRLNGTSGTPQTYVMNLNNPNVSYIAFNSTVQGHAAWSPNGILLGDTAWPYWIVATVLNQSGNFIPSKITPYLYTFMPLPVYSNFSITKVGPSNITQQTALGNAPFYCTWNANGTFLACSNNKGESPIYIMNENSGITRFVANSGATYTNYWGDPALDFLNNSNHIIFRSDRTGKPQIYEINLPGNFLVT